MSPTHRRLFILADEWLGIALLLYLWKTEDRLFQPVFIAWAIMIYVISYPLHWYKQHKEGKLEALVRDKAMKNFKLGL